jgi:hypothetical protein
MERTHEPLHFVKCSFVRRKIMEKPTSFIWIIIFFNRALEYGDISKLWGYVGTKAELLFVEFSNFVQRHIFVSHLSCYFLSRALNTETPTRRQ